MSKIGFIMVYSCLLRALFAPKMDMGCIHPSVGLGQVGLSFLTFDGCVGSDMPKVLYLYR